MELNEEMVQYRGQTTSVPFHIFTTCVWEHGADQSAAASVLDSEHCSSAPALNKQSCGHAGTLTEALDIQGLYYRRTAGRVGELQEGGILVEPISQTICHCPVYLV